MQFYPIGKQEFGRIRREGFVYVDKTEWVYRLTARSGQYFLSRPRRFGKSLLISTLEELFAGDRELFKGLWIEPHLDEIEQRPVLQISFNTLSYKQLGLEKALLDELQAIAAKNGIVLERQGIPSIFLEIIKKMAAEKPIAVLIDEYDKPILDYLMDIPQAEANREILKSFYSVLKGSENYIHFLLLTGVSKFTKVTIFSDLNHLWDLSLDDRFVTALGFTQQELETYFSERVAEIAATHNLTLEVAWAEIKKNYNGYSWDGKHFVYNPFSLLSFLQSGTFENYWYETGTPAFLVKYIRNRYLPDNIEGKVVQKAIFNKFDVSNIDLFDLMFQTGYLTVKKAEGEGMNAYFTLKYPNEEVRLSFENNLLSAFANQSSSVVSDQLYHLRKSLENLDDAAFVKQLKAFFASIPYEEAPDSKSPTALWEGHFHALTYLLLKVMGLDVQAKVASAKGKTDAVVTLPGCVWVIEFKLGTAAAAMRQIKKQGYAEPYLGGGKPIMLLGLGFDNAIRNVKTWKSQRLEA